MNNANKNTPNLMLRVAIPLRSASHGIRVAKAINRLYAGISDIVSTVDRKTVLGHSEITKIELSQD